MRGWIGVDLDGTLAHYEPGNYHHLTIGAPIPAMVERVKQWLAEGRDVRIFTARVSHDGTPQRTLETIDARVAISDWCIEHIGVALQVTCMKDYAMLELYDDRCVQVERNTGRLLGDSTR